MGDQDEEVGAEGRTLRRTRRSTRNASDASTSPAKSKPATRRTRKKIVMEVDGSDEGLEFTAEEPSYTENNDSSKEEKELLEDTLKNTDNSDNEEAFEEIITAEDTNEENLNKFESNGNVKLNGDESTLKEKEQDCSDKEDMDMEELKTNECEKDIEEVKEDEEKIENMETDEENDTKVQNGEPDAENISEDELPTVQAVKVPETEEVSDEELPGPKRAELPADTEVVSEDELPTVKKDTTKRKLAEGEYDPGSPTSEGEVPAKKPAVDKEVEKEKEEKPSKPKKLPELDKFWKAVNDDPTDFTGWTYLLQYVDQENDMEAAREAYDAFLSHYPYCYGYWRKYADYEKRKGNKKKCEEVFERGLKAIPLSVDLWLHYLAYVKTAKSEDEDFVRSQFERALTACGLEFRSDRLWDSYIKWETEGKRLQKVTSIYDRLLATPTQGYTAHFESFQEHVTTNSPNKVVDIDEFLALRKEVRTVLKHDTDTPANSDAPPGDEDPSKIVSTDEETKLIRERIISIRRKIHKTTVSAVTTRWNFEEGIKRPYFHVKPLERCQLKNWQEYLDYEMQQGDKSRTIVLFERCLIACALYEEFWLKFVHYLESLKDDEYIPKIRDVYERACTIHHLKKPNLHLQWALFEESNNNCNRAAEILVNLEKSVPNLLQLAYRRISLERRRGENDRCTQLFEHYINNSKSKAIASNLAIKYARFSLKILKSFDKALEILKSAVSKDPTNARLYLTILDLTLQSDSHTEKEITNIMDQFLEKEGTDPDQKIMFAQRKLVYLEDFGSDIKELEKAYEEYQKLCKLHGREIIKKKDSKSDTSVSKKEKASASSTASAQYGAYSNYNSSPGQTGYQYSGSQASQGQYNYPQYSQNDQYTYQSWQYQQGGYGGYNQWAGYGGGYGY